MPYETIYYLPIFIVWIVVAIILVMVFCSVFQRIRNKKLLKTVTDPCRGTRAERELLMRLLKCGIPGRAIFHDLYVEKPDGSFSQADLVVATAAGIVVFEVKDYSGWIFGRGDQLYWTQVLAYGQQKYRFYNPVMQNHGHIETLRKQSPQFRNVPFYSVVVFSGGCVLKKVDCVQQRTFIVKPSGVRDVMTYIMGNPPAEYADKWQVVDILEQAVRNGANAAIRARHIDNVRNMPGRDMY